MLISAVVVMIMWSDVGRLSFAVNAAVGLELLIVIRVVRSIHIGRRTIVMSNCSSNWRRRCKVVVAVEDHFELVAFCPFLRVWVYASAKCRTQYKRVPHLVHRVTVL